MTDLKVVEFAKKVKDKEKHKKFKDQVRLCIDIYDEDVQNEDCTGVVLLGFTESGLKIGYSNPEDLDVHIIGAIELAKQILLGVMYSIETEDE